jgi:hypothetical protein
MDRSIPAAIALAFALALLLLMLRSWLARRTRDAKLTAGYPLPLERAAELAAAPVFYVATTPRDTPLERLAIAGLGFRARAQVSVIDTGVLLTLAGSDTVYIPASAIENISNATVAIDRVVEKDGLLCLGWRLPAAQPDAAQPDTAQPDAAHPDARTSVDSYFRFSDPSDRVRILSSIRSMTAAAPGTAGTPESEA